MYLCVCVCVHVCACVCMRVCAYDCTVCATRVRLSTFAKACAPQDKTPPGPGTTLAQRAKEQETRYSSQVQHRPTAANYNILPDSVLYDYMFFR